LVDKNNCNQINMDLFPINRIKIQVLVFL